MKYIRTKNEIYEIIEGDNIVHTIFPPQRRNAYKSKSIVMDEAIKQADTIEELCDCFVGINGEEREIASSINALPFNHEYDEIYAAIWADKGLIYVAKINEKGDLELI